VVVVYVTASFLTVRVHGVIVTVFVVKVGLPLIVLVPVARVDVTVSGVTVVSVACSRVLIVAGKSWSAYFIQYRYGRLTYL
jgi:hypothetical protein